MTEERLRKKIAELERGNRIGVHKQLGMADLRKENDELRQEVKRLQGIVQQLAPEWLEEQLRPKQRSVRDELSR